MKTEHFPFMCGLKRVPRFAVLWGGEDDAALMALPDGCEKWHVSTDGLPRPGKTLVPRDPREVQARLLKHSATLECQLAVLPAHNESELAAQLWAMRQLSGQNGFGLVIASPVALVADDADGENARRHVPLNTAWPPAVGGGLAVPLGVIVDAGASTGAGTVALYWEAAADANAETKAMANVQWWTVKDGDEFKRRCEKAGRWGYGDGGEVDEGKVTRLLPSATTASEATTAHRVPSPRPPRPPREPLCQSPRSAFAEASADGPLGDYLNFVAHELDVLDRLVERGGQEIRITVEEGQPDRWDILLGPDWSYGEQHTDQHAARLLVQALHGQTLADSIAWPWLTYALPIIMAMDCHESVRRRVRTLLDNLSRERAPILPPSQAARFGRLLLGLTGDVGAKEQWPVCFRTVDSSEGHRSSWVSMMLACNHGLSPRLVPTAAEAHRLLDDPQLWATAADRQETLHATFVSWLEDIERAGAFQFYPAQKDLIARVAHKDGALVAADVGTGKTVMAIGLMQLIARFDGPLRILLVCPGATVRGGGPNIQAQWVAELEKFWPGVDVCRFGKEPAESVADTQRSRVVVAWFEQLRATWLEGDSSSLRGWDMAVIDEAHVMANPESDITAALMSIDAPRRYAFTATPMANGVMDLYCVLGWLANGRTFGSSIVVWSEQGGKHRVFCKPPSDVTLSWPFRFDEAHMTLFRSRYGSTIRNVAGERESERRAGRMVWLERDGHRISHLEELAALTAGLVAVITKEDVAPGFEAARVVVEEIPLSEVQRADYVAAGGDLGQAGTGRGKWHLMGKLRHVCAMGSDGRSPKVDRAMAIIQEQVAAGGHVLVVAARVVQSTAVADALTALGIPFARIDSTVPADSHALEAGRFREGSVPVLIMGQKCAAAHSFPRCRTMVVMSTEWSHGAMHQAGGRIDRINSVPDRTIHVLIHPGTVDQEIWNRTQVKKREAGRLLEAK